MASRHEAQFRFGGIMASVTGAGIAEAAGRLEAQIQSSPLLADDPLTPILREFVALARAVTDAIDRLEKLGSRPPGEEIFAAIERGSKAIAFRIGPNIDRRTSIFIAAALMLAGMIGSAVGYAAGSAEAGGRPIAACWNQKSARVCAPAIWIKTRRVT
jgi:hypothetical protein